MTIAKSAYVEGPLLVEKVLQSSSEFYYNAGFGHFVNTMGKGIVNSTENVRAALLAFSEASSQLTTADATVTEILKEEKGS